MFHEDAFTSGYFVCIRGRFLGQSTFIWQMWNTENNPEVWCKPSCKFWSSGKCKWTLVQFSNSLKAGGSLRRSNYFLNYFWQIQTSIFHSHSKSPQSHFTKSRSFFFEKKVKFNNSISKTSSICQLQLLIFQFWQNYKKQTETWSYIQFHLFPSRGQAQKHLQHTIHCVLQAFSGFNF